MNSMNKLVQINDIQAHLFQENKKIIKIVCRRNAKISLYSLSIHTYTCLVIAYNIQRI